MTWMHLEDNYDYEIHTLGPTISECGRFQPLVSFTPMSRRRRLRQNVSCSLAQKTEVEVNGIV